MKHPQKAGATKKITTATPPVKRGRPKKAESNSLTTAERRASFHEGYLAGVNDKYQNRVHLIIAQVRTPLISRRRLIEILTGTTL